MRQAIKDLLILQAEDLRIRDERRAFARDGRESGLQVADSMSFGKDWKRRSRTS